MKLTIFVTVLGLLAAPAIACSEAAMTREQIDKLPQDKVAVIKQQCAQKWNTDFDMRIFCEDKQYNALMTLMKRNGEDK